MMMKAVRIYLYAMSALLGVLTFKAVALGKWEAAWLGGVVFICACLLLYRTYLPDAHGE